MLLKGLLIGFAIAVPVGPVGFLCLRRTLVYGRITGFVSGLGAATADALYGLIAAFGLTAISAFLLENEKWLQFGGGLFLLSLGIKTVIAKPAATASSEGPAPTRSWPAAYFSTFAFTLASPATVLAFLAIFAGLGLGTKADSHLHALELVGGVFVGSAAWWLALSLGAGALRDRLHANTLHVMHVISGIFIGALGLWQLGVLTRSLLH